MHPTHRSSFVLLLSLLLSQAVAQPFDRQFVGIGDPAAGHVRQTPDGGYLLSGSYGQGSQAAGICVIKTDAFFQVEWSKIYQSSDNHLDYGIDAIATPDGGYAVLGTYDTEPWNAPLLAKLDYVLLKLDATGAVQWARRYGGSRSDLPFELALTADGGFLLSGYSSQGTDALGIPKPFILRTDANGQVLSSTLQTNFAFNLVVALLARPSFQMKAIETRDGGTVYALSSGEWGYFVKLNADGSIRWQRQIPMGGSALGGEADALWGVAATGGFVADIDELDNGDLVLLSNVFYFIAIGNGQSGGGVYIPVAAITRTDSLGQVRHASAFFHTTGQEGNLTDLFATDLAPLPNGNFLVCGSIGGWQVFLMEYDPSIAAFDQGSQWCRGFGWMNVSGYPYDYDIPRLGFTHNGDYLAFYDALRLHRIPADNPAADTCSRPLTIQSFPFAPAFQTANVSLATITTSAAVSYTAQDVAVSDTFRCESQGIAQAIGPRQAQPGLHLFPHPAQDRVSLTSPFGQPKAARIVLLDMQGRAVRQQQATLLPSTATDLDLHGLAAGLYFVQVRSDQAVFSGICRIAP
ncbi:MAG: hypothetical protein OHK0039_21210 [Bacteroidia bacterium]